MTPLALSRRTAESMARLAVIASRLLESLPSLWLDGHEGVVQLARFPARTRHWLQRGSLRREGLLSRLDLGISVSNRPALFEVNTTGAVGMFNHAAASSILRDLAGRLAPAPPRLGEPPDLVALYGQYLSRCVSRSSIGLLVEPDDLVAGSERLELAGAVRRRYGLDIREGGIAELEIAGGRIRLAGRRCDAVDRDIPYASIPVAHPGFADLVASGRVVPGPAAEFDVKGVLECLSSPAFAPLFSRRDQPLLARMVPWTRVIYPRRTEDLSGRSRPLERTLEDEQERLVIKPNAGLSGHGVMIGPSTPPGRWRRRIERALGEPGRWVAQRFVEVPAHPAAYLRDGEIHLEPCHAAFGLFSCPVGWGLHARLSPRRVVNVATGGALAVVGFSSR